MRMCVCVCVCKLTSLLTDRANFLFCLCAIASLGIVPMHVAIISIICSLA